MNKLSKLTYYAYWGKILNSPLKCENFLFPSSQILRPMCLSIGLSAILKLNFKLWAFDGFINRVIITK